MRNFLRIAEGIPIQTALLSLYRQPGLWNQVGLRTQTPGSPHAHAEDIILRMEPLDGSLPERQCIWYDAAAKLPDIRQLVMSLCAVVGCEQLGRVMVTRLQPGHTIFPHSDVGTHPLQYCRFRYWGRYHLPLQTDPAALFRVEDEIVHMAAGEAWYFRNDLEHEVFWAPDLQPDAQERIHIIADIHTANEPERE